MNVLIEMNHLVKSQGRLLLKEHLIHHLELGLIQIISNNHNNSHIIIITLIVIARGGQSGRGARHCG